MGLMRLLNFFSLLSLCRVGKGIWRRGAETPMAVKWEERIIEVREGSWSYIASSVGFAPGMTCPKSINAFSFYK